eukprot:GHVR01037228.1.p1 GENE.GHVR01037228.1~~GHVR01037228.1.p1  ORF type:complete len:453 (+),score=41.66 GHVR01037228.1:30-1361(+)
MKLLKFAILASLGVAAGEEKPLEDKGNHEGIIAGDGTNDRPSMRLKVPKGNDTDEVQVSTFSEGPPPLEPIQDGPPKLEPFPSNPPPLKPISDSRMKFPSESSRFSDLRVPGSYMFYQGEMICHCQPPWSFHANRFGRNSEIPPQFENAPFHDVRAQSAENKNYFSGFSGDTPYNQRGQFSPRDNFRSFPHEYPGEYFDREYPDPRMPMNQGFPYYPQQRPNQRRDFPGGLPEKARLKKDKQDNAGENDNPPEKKSRNLPRGYFPNKDFPVRRGYENFPDPRMPRVPPLPPVKYRTDNEFIPRGELTGYPNMGFNPFPPGQAPPGYMDKKGGYPGMNFYEFPRDMRPNRGEYPGMNFYDFPRDMRANMGENPGMNFYEFPRDMRPNRGEYPGMNSYDFPRDMRANRGEYPGMNFLEKSQKSPEGNSKDKSPKQNPEIPLKDNR